MKKMKFASKMVFFVQSMRQKCIIFSSSGLSYKIVHLKDLWHKRLQITVKQVNLELKNVDCQSTLSAQIFTRIIVHYP